VQAARLLALRAAWSYDEGRRGPLDGSLAKASAATAAAQLAAALTDVLPERAALLADPLGRFCRDSYAFDILEGTGDMHRLMVARRFGTEVTSGVRRGA
jgi:acyl-CoA dehydrogenase